MLWPNWWAKRAVPPNYQWVAVLLIYAVGVTLLLGTWWVTRATAIWTRDITLGPVFVAIVAASAFLGPRVASVLAWHGGLLPYVWPVPGWPPPPWWQTVLFWGASAVVILVLAKQRQMLSRANTHARDNELLYREAIAQMEQRVASEQRHRESENRFQLLANQAPVKIWMTDAGGSCTYINDRFLQYTGRAPDEELGAGWLDHLHPEDCTPTDIYARFHARKPFELSCRFRNRVGQYRWMFMSGVPRTGNDGNFGGYIGTCLDITAAREHETRVLQMQKMDAVGQLAGGIAHDFNNLLMVINTFTGFALERAEEGQLHDDLEQIQRAGARAAELTRKLLVFSRQQPQLVRTYDLNELIRDFATMLGRVIGEDIAITTQLTPEELLVRVDRTQVEQVLMNLALNARDAMPGGGTITIRTTRPFRPSPRGRVDMGVLEVTDTGTGIETPIRERMFEPFFTTKPAGHGTGMGLATVYGVVTQNEGEIEVESTPGEGATFRIWLPLEAPVGTATPVLRRPALPRGHDQTILLVEDEEIVRELTERMLRTRGFTVISASNGRAAMESLISHEGPVHAVVTDIVMPGMSGIELAERLRVMRPSLPVVFVSGYTEEEWQRRRLEVGTNFVAKPYDADALIDTLDQVMQQYARVAPIARI
jgi:PAS domain S-box-containing protein